MNNIKFRVWDKELKLMMVVIQISWDNNGNNIVEIVSCERDDDILYTYDEKEIKDRLVIMQSAGMKDIKDNEMYENDIVKLFSGRAYIIKYSNERMGFVSCSVITGDVLGKIFPDTILKVIGNVYENPELIEE